jgi:hypothetical protein
VVKEKGKKNFVVKKMKKYIILFSLITLLIVGLIASTHAIAYLRDENSRLTGNQNALLSDVRHYQTKDSLNVASVERLQFTNSELERYNSDLVKTVEDLNIKLKRLQSVSQTATKTTYNIETVFKDSLIVKYKDSTLVLDTLRCVNYNDAYLTFIACEKNDTLNAFIESRDTLITIVHRVPKRFWFIRWGTKAIRQEVISKNP